jgi:predicted dehydrogenase
VIGAGAFMGRQHLPNLARSPRFRIHTLCDLNAALLDERAAAFRPKVATTDMAEVFNNPDVDVVFVGTRSHQHAALILAALEHDKHVFVEKPMTMTLAETRRVLAAAGRSSAQVGIGFNRRYAPSVLAAKRLFDSFRRGSANVLYRIVDDHDIRPRYIFDLKDGGGHLLQEACHIFDLLAWFLGQEPVRIYATGPMETDNLITVTFADGSIAGILCGGKGGCFYPKECMEVFCNRTTLVLDQFYELRMDGPAGARVRTFPLAPNSRKLPAAARGMTAFYRASFAQRPAVAGDPARLIAAHRLFVDKGHVQMLDAFGKALQEGAPFPLSAAAGARATLCALRSYDSIRKGRPMPLHPEDYALDWAGASPTSSPRRASAPLPPRGAG